MQVKSDEKAENGPPIWSDLLSTIIRIEDRQRFARRLIAKLEARVAALESTRKKAVR